MAKIKFGKTIEEYMNKFGNEYEKGELWDFSLDDIKNGAVELDNDVVYWGINDRIYETSE